MQAIDLNKYLGKLQDYYASEKIIPSFSTLAALWDLKARSWVGKIIRRLVMENILEEAPGNRFRPGARFFERIVAHTVPAGAPHPGFEMAQDALMIDQFLIDHPSRVVLYPVRGESMVDLGILDGDIVIIERQETSQTGQVVLAMVDGEFTLKVLAHDKLGYYLQARNEKKVLDYPPIRAKNKLEVVGLCVGMFRKLRGK